MSRIADTYNPYGRIVSCTVHRVLGLIGSEPGIARTKVSGKNDSRGRLAVRVLTDDGYIRVDSADGGDRLWLTPKGTTLLSLMDDVRAFVDEDWARYAASLSATGGGSHD